MKGAPRHWEGGRIETGEGDKRERAELKADGDVRVPDVVN